MQLQTGFASTTALPLGDSGRGAGQQDMAVFQFNNVFLNKDGVTLYNWQSIDRNGVPQWDATIMYKIHVVNIGGGTISGSTAVQRWHLPLVAGTNDWVSGNSLYYDRPGKFPISLEADAKTVIGANRDIARGSFLVFAATTSTPLKKIGPYALSLRHGPTLVEGLGMYQVNGARLFRYQGALVVSRGPYSFEFIGGPQIGLQSGINNSTYWAASLSRSFHLFGPHE